MRKRLYDTRVCGKETCPSGTECCPTDVQGLFHKAILEAGGVFCPWGHGGHAREMLQLFKRAAGMENEPRDVVVQKLIEKDPEALMEYYRRAMAEYQEVITKSEILGYI